MIKYTNRMREDSSLFQQAYAMISSVINEARQRDATELIDNLPFTSQELGDLRRHDAVLIKTLDYDLDSVNEAGTRLRERFLYLYRHKIILCRRKRVDSRLDPRSLIFKQAYNVRCLLYALHIIKKLPMNRFRQMKSHLFKKIFLMMTKNLKLHLTTTNV